MNQFLVLFLFNLSSKMSGSQKSHKLFFAPIICSMQKWPITANFKFFQQLFWNEEII